MYTSSDGKEWSVPISVSVPFESYTPLLLADSSGYIHAFWTDEDQVLRYANVLASAIPTSAWTPAEVLAGSTVAFDVEIDAQDRFHLAYVRDIRSPEAPAGVYYRRSGSGGNSWDTLVLLYQSLYLRILSPEDAYVDIEIADFEDAEQIFVGWDNRPRSRIYLAISSDGGSTWSDPQEIDKPEQGGGSASPSDLTVYAQEDKVLLVWRADSEDTSCSQYYQWSLDGGETWQPRQRFSVGFIGCADYIRILKGPDGPILLLASTEVYLQAWDGTRWSDPQIQSALTSFTDPETQQTINLACQQYTLVAGQLLAAGCNAGAEGGDIWWLSRDLTDTAEWFPQESAWQPLTSVTRGQSRFLTLALVADSQERLHVLWSQSGDAVFDEPDTSLYYARWEGERLWSQRVAILSSPEDPADQPAVTLSPVGQLLVVWRRGSNREIYFSQASTSQAVLPDAWSEPQRLSDPGQMASAPDILVDGQGGIYVVYAVPVNEGRGIYLTRSSDGGQTWSNPAKLFDAAAAGWAMINRPRLALSGNGHLHLLWTRYNLRSGQLEPLALAYAHSQDGGETWSTPESVVEHPVIWSRIIGLGDQTVHRFWQELTAGQTTTLWHERSLDDGRTWERIAPISIFGQAIGSPSLIWDHVGDLHLLQVISRGTGGYVLQHWIWDGQRWGGSDSRSQEELFFTARSVEQLGGLAAPLPAAPATPVVMATPSPEPTALPTPTPTPDLSALGAAGSGANVGSSWDGLMIGAVLAGTIVALVFGIGVWKAKGG
jgi:hypothetical protein